MSNHSFLSTEYQSIVTEVYPWQVTLWHQVYSMQYQHNQIPHALLLAGSIGVGKEHFALHLARGLLCQSPQINSQTHELEPCSQFSDTLCRSCQLFQVNNHPDFNYIEIPNDKKIIAVDTIREVIQWTVLSAQLSINKVILINPAEAMNNNAANSLLKTLEEPIDNTIIILLSQFMYL
jgi:DNA polymerase-3 subunit delta'